MSASAETVVVAFGGGINSYAMLIGMIARREPAPHAILFADTGGEQPRTYQGLRIFDTYLRRHGYPPITIVSKAGNEVTLEEDCLAKNMPPSIAYGYKTCSQKFKVEPQEKGANNDHVCRKTWRAGGKVVKVIGYDYDELHRAKFYEDPKYERRYPLIDWKWGRQTCVYVIEKVGLPVPGKSSCFFCPHMRKHEILKLRDEHPELLQRALAMEAQTKLTKIKGLGRRFAWRDFLAGQSIDDSAEAEKELPCGCYDGEAAA